MTPESKHPISKELREAWEKQGFAKLFDNIGLNQGEHFGFKIVTSLNESILQFVAAQREEAVRERTEEIISLFGDHLFAIEVMSSLPVARGVKNVDFGYRGILIQRALSERFLPTSLTPEKHGN